MNIVIGAGISGLTAGKFLDGDFKILEKQNVSGGLATQYLSGGEYFDYGGHYFHFKDKSKIKSYVEKFSDFHEYVRKSKVYVFNRLIPFPVQFHLSFLPKKIAKRILTEILNRTDKESSDLEKYLLNNFGKTLCDFFFFPFLKKYYGCDLRKIVPFMDRGSIPIPAKEDVLEGFKGKLFGDRGYNPRFFYPEQSLKGFIDSYEKSVKKNIVFGEEVERIDLNKKRVSTKRGSYLYETLINTIPLKQFIYMIDKWEFYFPEAKNLEHISTVVVNLILKKRKRMFHWVYIPRPDLSFYRAGFYPGKRLPVCYLERSLNPGEILDRAKMEFESVQTLKELNLIERKSDILYMDIKKIPVSYIIFNRSWGKDVPALLKKLKTMGVESTGRYGRWDYSSMSDDIKSAMGTAVMVNNKNQLI